MEVVPRKRRPYSTLEKLEMKKTLVALAAIASVSAFAQVTITGNLDMAGATQSGTQTGAKGSTVTTGQGTSSTSGIKITAAEDIGGGNVISAIYEIDPRTWANDGMGVTNMTANGGSAYPVNPQGTTVTGLARHEAYVGITSSNGSLKLGAMNSVGFDAHAVSSPMGTGIASGYGVGATYMIRNAFRDTRYDRSVRLDSAVINGFKVSGLYAPGNDEAAVASSSADSYVARNMPNNRKITEIGVNYSNGPLNVQWTNHQVAAQTNAVGYYGVVASATSTMTTTYGYVATKSNILGANYNLGSTTLYAAWWNGDSTASTTAVKRASGNRYAIKQNLGSVDLMAQYTQATHDTTTAKVLGFRGDYNLSKTSAVYLGYENWDTGSAASATNTTSGTRKTTSVGLRKSF